MREAVGGAWLFYIIIGFLGIYIVFIGFIMNYASAYRASNYVIEYIEEYEGRANVGGSDLAGILNTKYGYDASSNGISTVCRRNANGAVYTVTTYIPFEIPLLNLKIKIPVVNETKTIYGMDC